MITGEEVLAEVVYIPEKDPYYLLHNPIVIEEILHMDTRSGSMAMGLSPKKWMTYASDNMTIVYKSHVVSVSEMDRFGEEFYEKAVIAAKITSPIKKKVSSTSNSGFVGNIDSYRKKLETLYNKID